MYGLPQARLLANVLLETRLNTHEYHQNKLVPGLWIHDWHPIQFTLVVDNFVINKLVKNTHNISSQCYRSTTKLLLIGRAPATLASPWTGTTPNAELTCPCLAMSRKHSTNFSTPNQRPHNMRRFPLCPSNMAPEHNMPKHPPRRRHSTKKARNLSNKSAVNSSFLVVWWTPHSSAPSVPSPPNP
ncbi:hypothetical protein ACHAW6_004555 [Cyclotella cf. meneghiniana]